MADFPFSKLVEPLSPDQPCGPDLEMDGDVDFMRFSARVDGILPASYFRFDSRAVDLPAEIDLIGALSRRTIDLRLLAAAAKFFILNRDVTSFEKVITTIAHVLETLWEHVHPQLIDGDAVFRLIAIQTLDDAPHTVLPLQGAPLIKTRRFGALSYRAYLLSEGQIEARKADEEGGSDEKAPSIGDVRSALQEADLAELVALRDTAARLHGALQSIETVFDAKSGQPGALRFDRLKPLSLELMRFAERAVVIRDPSLSSGVDVDAAVDVSEDAGATVTPHQGALLSVAEAVGALEVALGYFNRHEPSSPTRLLLVQARSLVGKSFYDALVSIVPDFASQAAIKLGRDVPLSLPVHRLSELLPEPDVAEHSAGNDDAGISQPDDAEDGERVQDAELTIDGLEGAAGLMPEPIKAKQPAATVQTRAAAIQLIDAAANFFRATEPSSPIPLLLDQARAASGRDFMALLRDTLPSAALRVDD